MVKAVTMYKDTNGRAHETAREAEAADRKTEIFRLLKKCAGHADLRDARVPEWLYSAAYYLSRTPSLANDIIAALEKHAKTLPPKETE